MPQLPTLQPRAARKKTYELAELHVVNEGTTNLGSRYPEAPLRRDLLAVTYVSL